MGRWYSVGVYESVNHAPVGVSTTSLTNVFGGVPSR